MTPTNESPSDKEARRHFLEIFLGTGIIASLLSFLYPVIRYLIPPPQTDLGSNTVLAAKVGELSVNSGKIFRFGDKPAILILTSGDKYVAFTAVCTHLGCTVQYRPDLREIWCPCHNGKYNLQGRNISGPPPKPLAEFTVNVKGADIYVSRTAAS
ncbi:MAG TPA: Rieske 2Fe-2S domain-containing protein [Candidatus Dormibacteraeota bacterium]|nr:Rieske 2Fe-2S domain-containing protein [Candidatus Dormibacteraeota bacterium]